MTERELQLLGFKKEESDGATHIKEDGSEWMEDQFYYYSLDIAAGFGFITCASDEVGEDGQWFVEFFDSDPQIRFTEFGELQALINLITSRIVK
jgi:hypothetical protein